MRPLAAVPTKFSARGQLFVAPSVSTGAPHVKREPLPLLNALAAGAGDLVLEQLLELELAPAPLTHNCDGFDHLRPVKRFFGAAAAIERSRVNASSPSCSEPHARL